MRVKQTAKKILNENPNVSANTNNSIDIESSDHNSCDNLNDISDNEVEILVECRRDQEGNQFLLDGTLVIEPASVDISNECKENKSSIEEINFSDFIKGLQVKPPENINKVIDSPIVSKRNVANCGSKFNLFTNVKCTACTTKYNPFIGNNLFKHPLMEVLLCSNCIQNQKDEFFVTDKDDNKETLCRWCVEGGSLICCDFCPKSYCKPCIKRNLGRTILSEILNQDDSVQWKCFVCEPTPIEPLKKQCRKVYEDVQKFVDDQRFQKLAKRPIARLTDIANKKRSISKAFPGDSDGGGGGMASKQVSGVKPVVVMMGTGTGVSPGIGVKVGKTVINDMSSYGTDWYMRNVKLRNIFTEIDEIDARSLLNAINSTKKCIEAFYSDIRNLEVEIGKAATAADIVGIVAMFKSVYRHHIFNRFCHVKTRMGEDRAARARAQTSSGSSADDHQTHMTNGSQSASTSPTVANGRHTQTETNGTEDSHRIIMASIDLTEEPDKLDEPSSPAPPVTGVPSQRVANRSIMEAVLYQGGYVLPRVVVDLCADDDSVATSGNQCLDQQHSTDSDQELVVDTGVASGPRATD